MGNPTDSAPPYEDLYHNHNHQISQRFGLGSSSKYSAVLQDEQDAPDLEPGAQASLGVQADTPLQTLSKPDDSQLDMHCEGCDRLVELKVRHSHQLKCCGIVAATFMAAFVCAVFIVIAVVR